MAWCSGAYDQLAAEATSLANPLIRQEGCKPWAQNAENLMRNVELGKPGWRFWAAGLWRAQTEVSGFCGNEREGQALRGALDWFFWAGCHAGAWCETCGYPDLARFGLLPRPRS